jgi:hypothetical protein
MLHPGGEGGPVMWFENDDVLIQPGMLCPDRLLHHVAILARSRRRSNCQIRLSSQIIDSNRYPQAASRSHL